MMRSYQSILLLFSVMAALFLSVLTCSEALAGDGAQGAAALTGATINLSHDLIRMGIASENLAPDSPSTDARPLFQAALAYAAVIRLVVLQPEVRDMVAEREKKMIAAVMARTEESARLHHQVLVLVHHLGADFECPIAIGRQVQKVRDSVVGPQVDGLIVLSRG